MIVFLRTYGAILILLSIMAIMSLSLQPATVDIPHDVQTYLYTIIVVGLTIGAILGTAKEVK